MTIYERFENFVKEKGKPVKETESFGGKKTVWEVGNRIVVIDENPFEDNQRIVMVIVLEGDNEIIEYLSPASVFGGALEQLPVSVSPDKISSPSVLELILKELETTQ